MVINKLCQQDSIARRASLSFACLSFVQSFQPYKHIKTCKIRLPCNLLVYVLSWISLIEQILFVIYLFVYLFIYLSINLSYISCMSSIVFMSFSVYSQNEFNIPHSTYLSIYLSIYKCNFLSVYPSRYSQHEFNGSYAALYFPSWNVVDCRRRALLQETSINQSINQSINHIFLSQATDSFV